MTQIPKGVSQIATITQMRAKTITLVDAANEAGPVCVMKNNVPVAYLVSPDDFAKLSR